MKVYIDFDRTIFDCAKFLKDLFILINKYNIDRALFEKCQNQCINEGFNPYLILNLVKKSFDFNDNLYTEIDGLIKKSSDYLFSDTIYFLKYLQETKYEIVILTKGNFEYQKEKIIHANIDKYYNELIITMKHKGDLDLDYENGIFIDDNQQEILSIIKNKPKKVIYLNRDNAKYSDIISDKNICIVNSLMDIVMKKEL